MDLSRESPVDKVLICSVTPYFLEKGNLWFDENLEKILAARKTQAFFEDNIIFCKPNEAHNLSQFLRKLDEMGYEKVLSVSYPGEFSHRGGMIEVFPINLSYAIRLEFLGNKIETIERLETSVEDENAAKEIIKKRLKSQKLFSDLKGLKPGDFLVHLDHGIGLYKCQQEINNHQYYQIEYAEGDRLFVPFGLERKLSRYVGFADPKVSRLGSLTWQRTKKRIKEDVEKLAKELLEIYAQREIVKRKPYLEQDEIDLQLASGFNYSETPDQLQAIKEIEKDLEQDKPMDRIVCGDVGFGKTEVALRAIVKAIKSGYQAAMLCPTTILANQHYRNFQKRLEKLPIRITMLSRLQSKKEQKKAVEGLKSGKIDAVIGTHRILSKDVDFQNLGLLVIDDEQRFGVRQKEKFKQIRSSLDVLSLSATPIPRTLYLSLSSFRNISLIQTPPEGRRPIKTFILPWKEKIIKEAIEKELERGGQVYFLHNRIDTIEGMKRFLEKILSKESGKGNHIKKSVKIGVAHGRLSEKELVKIMDDFQNKKIDVLLATTIIENGIDLPNVNALIVADATRLGLAQAYQIRGRVGRSHIQASAYFLYNKRSLTEIAEQRLNALKEAEDLGSGYRIAMKDLEIRGAGNILGKEQSGNINRIGLNLYCQLLSEAVEKLKIESK